MSLKQKAITGIKWTGASTAIRIALHLLQLAILGRILQPSDFGLLSMAMVAIGFIQIFSDMGISNALIHKQNITHRELSSLYWLNVFSGIVAFFIIWLLSPLVSSLYSETHLTHILRLLATAFLIIPWGQQFLLLLQKDLKFDSLSQIEIFSSLLGASIAIFTAFHNQGVYSLVWGQLTTTISRTIALIIIGYSNWKPSFIFHKNLISKYLSFGLYQIGERSINYISWNLDKLLIGYLLGSKELGVYSIAYQLMIQPMQAINPVITKVSFPVFSKIQNQDQQLRQAYIQTITAISFLTMPIYLGMYSISDLLIPVLLGNQWEDVIIILNILIILGIYYSLGNPIGSLLLSKGRADLGFWFNLFIIIITIPTIIISSHFGAIGIAYGLVIINTLLFFPTGLLLSWFVIRLSPIQFAISFILFLIVACLMAIFVNFLKTYIHTPVQIVNLIILVTCGAFFYLTLLYFLKNDFISTIFYNLRGKK